MPQLRKEALSQFARTQCLRQLRLNLFPDRIEFRGEREIQSMPPRQPPRPGYTELTQLGKEWQANVLLDLMQAFGQGMIVGMKSSNPNHAEKYVPVELIDVLQRAPVGSFIPEAQFDIGNTFKTAMEIVEYDALYGLSFARLRPDFIEVISANIAEEESNKNISARGDVIRLSDNDQRLQLRVIDAKLTAEPSRSHFAEVTYYSMALSAWLVDQGLDDMYVVVPNAAVWPGSHDASNLRKTFCEITKEGRVPAIRDLRVAMQKDLETVPFEVFASFIRHFLQVDVKKALSEHPWECFPWHLDNRCTGCDYIGYMDWLDENKNPTYNCKHCMPTAKETRHLSMIPYMSRGARTTLEEKFGVKDVSSLAKLNPADEALDSHHDLRATRHIVTQRASSFTKKRAAIALQSGLSSLMPKWADLHVYITVNFDLGSAITFAIGLEAFCSDHQPYGVLGPRSRHHWGPFTFIIDKRDVLIEQKQLLRFLDQINKITKSARERNKDTTVQFYLWDSAQFNHLARIIGRHLSVVLEEHTLAGLAWLFPPSDLLPNPVMETRKSPITIVEDVVRNHVIASVSHCYTLFTVAREYHHQSLSEEDAEFEVYRYFEDKLSSQIPSERAHQVWADREGASITLQNLHRVVKLQLKALQTITRRLEWDLRDRLQQIAPQINFGPPRLQSGISLDGQLWYGFAKLDAALSELEVCQIRAMPPHEREARFHSARLIKRIVGREETIILDRLGFKPDPLRRRVYKLRSGSRDTKIREGEFNLALAPESYIGFLDQSLKRVARNLPFQPSDIPPWIKMESVTKVTVEAIDRDNEVIVLDLNSTYRHWLDILEEYRVINLEKEVVLDPISSDYFTKPLLNTLQAIGSPPNSQVDPLIKRALGVASTYKRGERFGSSPAGDFLWSAKLLAESSSKRELGIFRRILEGRGISLNDWQWDAWKLALQQRLQLIWGPPGTGKSRTLRAVALGAVLHADINHQSRRILVCAQTYNAVDNVIIEGYPDSLTLLSFLKKMKLRADVEVYRIRSSHKKPEAKIPRDMDLELNKYNSSKRVLSLCERLENKQGITLIGATPQQVHKLLEIASNSSMAELFDFIILDEASQMDVAHSILAIASIARDGSLVVAGDPQQLPPIHKATPPAGLESMVGSIYDFFAEKYEIKPFELKMNYRSNQTIVDFAHETGYGRSLKSRSPELRINLIRDLSLESTSVNWPRSLYWTPHWSLLLNPAHTVTCFVYPEGASGQWNLFEADAVCSLAFLLHGCLGRQLLFERHHQTRKFLPQSSELYEADEFWEKGVGIVTPHRAQQALIISRLQDIFSPPPFNVSKSSIRGAVDTVERFQGQQRDIIIASYALGDPDAIRDEEEFLMSHNRFNVMVSRTRAKIITLVSEEVTNHLSNDVDVLRASRLLKVFTDSFCNKSQLITLGYIDQGKTILVPGILKYR